MDPTLTENSSESQTARPQRRWKWALIGYGLLIVVAIAIALVIHRGGGSSKPGSRVLPTGQLDVSTSDPQTSVRLTWIGPASEVSSTEVASSTGDLQDTVPAGPYTVTATLGDFSAQQVVTVVAGKTTNISITPAKHGAVEPVTDRDAEGVSATSEQLRYFDTTNGDLYTINNAGRESEVDSGHGFTSLQWADPSYGVGKGTGGELYLINGNTVTPIAQPFAPSANGTTYALAPNRDLYVSNGKKVYVSVSGGAFNQIYSSSYTVAVTAAGSNAVAANESVPGDQDSGNILAISPSGNVRKRSGNAYGAAWSASGTYLAITSDEQTIITDASLNEVASIPVGNVNAPAWLGNTTLFYGVTSDLWEFNIITGKANLLATIHSGDYISAIYPSLSSDYVYLTMQNNGSNSSTNPFYLDRVGLAGQSASDIAVSLQGLLPEQVGNCTAGYINFTVPTIELRGPGALSGSCTEATQAFLQPYSSVFNVSAVTYQFSAN
jgi:hypothetical protein